MRGRSEFEGSDDEVGDSEEGPDRGEYEKVDFRCGIEVRGDYNMSAHCRGLSHVILLLTICQQAQDNKREQRLDAAHGEEECLS